MVDKMFDIKSFEINGFPVSRRVYLKLGDGACHFSPLSHATYQRTTKLPVENDWAVG